MTIPPIPVPVPLSASPDNFDERADAFVAALPAVVEGMNAQNEENNAINENVNAKALAAEASATAAAASQAASATSASAAAASQAAAATTVDTVSASATAAANSASIAAGHAASASSVVQQDLSGVTAAALHRSPNAITALFVYDTSKDSDGGAWTEKCQHTSWYNEALNGKWLGALATEAAARAVVGVATGDFFQRTSDGRFWSLNAGSGITEVFRGNKRDFPRLSAIVAEGSNVTIYDLTEPGRPMWMRFAQGANNWLFSAASTVAAGNGLVVVGGSTGYCGFSFAADKGEIRTASGTSALRGYLSNRNAGLSFSFVGAGGAIANSTVNAVAMTVLPAAPIDPATGLQVPTIAVATSGGVSVIQHSGAVVNPVPGGHQNVLFDAGNRLWAGGSDGSTWGVRLIRADFTGQEYFFSNVTFSASSPPVMSGVTGVVSLRLLTNKMVFAADANGRLNIIRANKGRKAGSTNLHITNTFNTGHITGDIRRAYLADVDAGSVVGPATVADRSYKASGASVVGTLTKTPVATGAQLVAYSGFSAANYLREPFHADLDFGAGEWTANAWINFTTAAASTIASREAASGAFIRFGTTSTGQLTATAFDGTTTRTVTTTATYNTGTWIKARANYRAGRLSILVNGVEVAVTNGPPLLTLNNAAAVLTIGNSFALDAPFPGSIALLQFSATVPSAEQAIWMFEQEKQMFRDGAQVTLPDAGAIIDLAYDDATDKWIAVSATNESEWSGLVRTSVTPAPAGSYSRVAAASGIQLLARTTTSPGVDVTIPAYGLREELVKRAEAVARANKDAVAFDFDTVSFTAAMTSGSNQVTASAITGTPYIGMAVTGTGLPAGTTIHGINGTTYALSANATATGSNTVGQASFDLPPGFTARVVYSAGTQRREGATRDFIRQFDGFRERVLFAVTPGASAWIQIHAVKESS